MKPAKVMEIYSYVCSKNGEEVTVGEIMDRFSIKKNDIVRFLNLLMQYENIDFYYYSPEDEDEDYIDDIQDIKNDTIIEISDNFKDIALKLDMKDTIRLLEIIEDSYISPKPSEEVLTQIGQPSAVKYNYINKGVPKFHNESNVLYIKNKILNFIFNGVIVELDYFSKSKSEVKHLKEILPLGIYFDDFKKIWFFVGTDNKKRKAVFELRLDRIRKVINTGKNTDKEEEFHINEYLSRKRKSKLVLKAYDEANVIAKIKDIFSSYDVTSEDYDGHCILTIAVDDATYYKPVIDSFGKSVEVLQPERLRKRIKESDTKMLERYFEAHKYI